MRFFLLCTFFVCISASALQTREKLAQYVTPFLNTAEVSYEVFPADTSKKVGVLTWKGKDQAADPLVIIPGRGEISYQWAENAFDVRSIGFDGDIKVWDPPGQGLSSRLFPGDRGVGHINRFQDFVTALIYYLRKLGRKPVLLAHSMGGAIAINTLATDTNLASYFIGDAGMFDVHLSNNRFVQSFEKQILEYLNRFDLLQNFVVGRSGAGRPTTSDQDRLEYRNSIMDRFDGHVPGKTLHWASEANRGVASAIARAHNIKIPMTLFIAGNDHIIDPDGAVAIRDACKGNCELIRVEGSEHAIHEEIDPMRLQIIQKLAQVLNLSCDGLLRSESRRLVLGAD